MEKMRVAVGTVDGKNITEDHLGESAVFVIADIYPDGSYTIVEKRENSSPPEEKGRHGIDKKRSAVVKILHDCDVLVSRYMSPNLKRIAAGTEKQPIVVSGEKLLEDVFLRIASVYDVLENLVEERKRGKRPEVLKI